MTLSSSPAIVLCIGIPVRDLTFRIDAVPARGEKVSADHFSEISGGNALNAAIGIVRLGGRASLAGPMGDSAEIAGQSIFDALTGEGIEFGHLLHMPGLATPLSAIMIDPTGERTIVTFRDPRLWHVDLPPADALLQDCNAVLIESRCASFAGDVVTEARRRGIPVIVDVDRTMSISDELLTTASHLICSSEALQGTVGIADDAAALRKLAELTPAFLAVTRGAKGTLWFDAHGAIRETPAFAVESVDTLGAGDVFHGAFAVALTEAKSMDEALRFASAAAALKCTRHGGAFAAPQRPEVERFLSLSKPDA